jgi:hypothetical protein
MGMATMQATKKSQMAVWRSLMLIKIGDSDWNDFFPLGPGKPRHTEIS